MSSRGCGRVGSVGRVRALAVRLLSKRRMVLKAEKLCHAGDFQVGGGLVGWLVRFLGDVAEVDVELVAFGGVGPADRRWRWPSFDDVRSGLGFQRSWARERYSTA